MATDSFLSDLAVERHDTRRDLANLGIRDEDLRDEIISTIVDEGTLHWQEDPSVYVAGLHSPGGNLTQEDLERVIDLAIQLTAERIAEDIEDQGRDLDIVGHTAGVVRDAHMSAAGVARALAALYGAEADR